MLYYIKWETQMTISELIINKLELPYIIKTKRSNCRELTSIEVIEAIVYNNTCSMAAKSLGIGEQTLNRIIYKNLKPKLGILQGGNETWRYVLLKCIEYKYCYTCNSIKEYSKFGLDKHTSDGRFSKCKYCRSFDNASMYEKRKLRIPTWFVDESEKIAEFYDNCPEGYHVDHIIPLCGQHVSGLHTLNNLQYLLAKENIQKSNFYNIDTGK